MDKPSDKRVEELKDRLDRGEYSVDPSAVADAILRRSRELARLRSEMRAGAGVELGGRAQVPVTDQSSCSNPRRSRWASMKVSPGSPWLTRPIQLIGTGVEALASAFSTVARALRGAQTQSS